MWRSSGGPRTFRGAIDGSKVGNPVIALPTVNAETAATGNSVAKMSWQFGDRRPDHEDSGREVSQKPGARLWQRFTAGEQNVLLEKMSGQREP